MILYCEQSGDTPVYTVLECWIVIVWKILTFIASFEVVLMHSAPNRIAFHIDYLAICTFITSRILYFHHCTHFFLFITCHFLTNTTINQQLVVLMLPCPQSTRLNPLTLRQNATLKPKLKRFWRVTHCFTVVIDKSLQHLYFVAFSRLPCLITTEHTVLS
jgi:hypothetical protein